MAATLSAAVAEVLTTCYASVNAALSPTSAERISVYQVMIQGLPTNRYAAVYCPPETLRRSAVDGRARDAFVQFQVTFAGTGDAAAAATLKALQIAQKGTQALVDATLAVDGLSGNLFVQHDFSNIPRAVEVVADRPTVEVVAMFSLWADRVLS